VFFSALAGGILCGKCHQRKAWRGALIVPGKALRVLDDLATLPRAGGEADPGSDWHTEPDLVSALRRILDEMRTTLLDRRFVMGDYVLL